MKKINIITGATASGKSDLALTIATELKNVEIISADAFQVYRGLNIGTAKATKEVRLITPHHLIDIEDPDVSYTAGKFKIEAEKAIHDILSRDKIPLIVGGTGLYIKTLTDGLFDCPLIDPEVRLSLEVRLKEVGLPQLYAELLAVDKEYATKISENDSVRILRALEVYTALHIPFTVAHKKYQKEPKYQYNLNIIEEDRSSLYNKINRRVDDMWNGGWVDEVKLLLSQGYKADAPAFRAIGYKPIIDYINSEIGEYQVKDNIARDTRHFAKRQLTWFRSMQNAIFYSSKDKLLEDILSNV